MKKWQSVRGWLAICLLASLGACSSVAPQYHQLQADIPARQPLQPGVIVLVELASLPASVERPQLMLEDPQGQPHLLEQQYWTASLSRLLTQALAGNLSHLLGLSTVYAAPQLSLAHADLHLQLDVREFHLRRGQGAALAAAWRVSREGQAVPLIQGYFNQQQAVGTDDSAVLVAAQQSLLDKLSRQIAGDLRAYQDGNLRLAPP